MDGTTMFLGHTTMPNGASGSHQAAMDQHNSFTKAVHMHMRMRIQCMVQVSGHDNYILVSLKLQTLGFLYSISPVLSD